MADFKSSSGAPMLAMSSLEVGRMQMARDEREHLNARNSGLSRATDGRGLILGHDTPSCPRDRRHRRTAEAAVVTRRPSRHRFQPSQSQIASPMMSFLSASGIQSIS